jgi:hypothetical protein
MGLIRQAVAIVTICSFVLECGLASPGKYALVAVQKQVLHLPAEPKQKPSKLDMLFDSS